MNDVPAAVETPRRRRDAPAGRLYGVRPTYTPMRTLIQICLQRPVAVTAFYLLVVVLAGAAAVRLPVALLPDLQYPGLVVWTAYPDVPPERVERAVTERIEEAVSGTTGLQRVTSRSILGGSLVRLDFGWNANLDLAFLEAREQIDRLGNALPEEAERPAVLRLNPNDRPIMMIALHGGGSGGDAQDLVHLKRVAREVAARRLEALSDVARVQVTGGYDPQIEVRVDPARLATYGLDLDQLSRALQQSNVSLPGGMIRRGPFRYAVEVSGEFSDLDDIASTVVLQSSSGPIRLRDVAEVREGVEDRRGLVRFNGQETLLLLVERRPDANTVRAAEEVRVVLGELEAELNGVAFDVVVDESRFIEQAIGGVTQAVWLGGLLAVVILLVFLRRLFALLAIAVAIPLSIGLTFILFEAFGVTFNLISLSGLALGIGLLLDNAIVVVENITRLREQGLGRMEAALEGTREVIGAITASTLTTIAVFLPITFVEGLAGRLFRDQSLAVVCSLLASLLVAFTVVPLIVSRSRRDSAVSSIRADRPVGPVQEPASQNSAEGPVGPVQEPASQNSAGGPVGPVQEPASQNSAKRRPIHESAVRGGAGAALYESMLSWSLSHRALVLGLAAVLLAGAAWLGLRLPREVIPRADQGRIDVRFSLPADADLPLLSTRADALETWLEAQGLSSGWLVDLGERDENRLELDPRPAYEGDVLLLLDESVSAWEALDRLGEFAWPEGVTASIHPVRTQLEALLAPDEADLLIDLQADDRRDTEEHIPALLEALGRESAVANARRADTESIPAYRIRFKEDVLSRFGVQPAQLATYLEAGARGRRATELRSINEDVPVVIRARHVTSLETLLAEQIPTPNGLMPVSAFVEVESVLLPAALMRVAQAPIVRLEADLAPGAGVAEGERAVRAAFDETLPVDVRGRVGGASEAFQSGLRAVALSMLVSLLLVYLILAAQFESFVQPFIILSAVPLAMIGVVGVLAATGHSLNLMSLTGAVVLVGIVVNDAIIKVDFINQRRAAGLTIDYAIRAAGRDRLRPILMTTFTTMLGMLPLVLASGEGSELRGALAIAVVGGLAAATLLTLFVVPVLYAVSSAD